MGTSGRVASMMAPETQSALNTATKTIRGTTAARTT